MWDNSKIPMLREDARWIIGQRRSLHSHWLHDPLSFCHPSTIPSPWSLFYFLNRSACLPFSHSHSLTLSLHAIIATPYCALVLSILCFLIRDHWTASPSADWESLYLEQWTPSQFSFMSLFQRSSFHPLLSSSILCDCAPQSNDLVTGYEY